MTKGLLYSTLAAAAIISSSPAAAAQHRDARLGYFLPRARVDVVVNQTILACPGGTDQPDPRIRTDVGIETVTEPDPGAFIVLDANSHFLSARTTKLGLRADGTLSSYSVDITGEGGEVLSAVIGLATTIVGSMVGFPAGVATAAEASPPPPPPSPLTCNADTIRRLQEQAQVEHQLDELRAHIADGTAPSGSGQTLTDLSARLTRLVSALTLRSSIPVRAPIAGPVAVGRANYESWFIERGAALDAGLLYHKVGGLYGSVVTLTPDSNMHAILSRGDGSPPPTSPSLNLYYRRPVPTEAAVAWCAGPVNAQTCTPWTDVLESKTVFLPQLSGNFSIPVGRGGIFGTRSASATFDEQGAPLTLAYGASPGGAQIANVINSADTAVTTLRDAGTAAISRELTRAQALHDLNALRTQANPKPATQPPTGD